jgi:hypothetical protein
LAKIISLFMVLGLAACRSPVEGAPPPEGVDALAATLLVAGAQAAMVRGDWVTAHSLVDFEAKSERLFGELYEKATPEERARLHAILRDQLRKTWERTWAPRVLELASISIRRADGATDVTLSLPADELSERVEMTWTVAPSAAGPRIVDREVSLGGRGSTTRAFVHLVVSKAKDKRGGDLTLGDVVDQIERTIDTTMIRRIPITAP